MCLEAMHLINYSASAAHSHEMKFACKDMRSSEDSLKRPELNGEEQTQQTV